MFPGAGEEPDDEYVKKFYESTIRLKNRQELLRECKELGVSTSRVLNFEGDAALGSPRQHSQRYVNLPNSQIRRSQLSHNSTHSCDGAVIAQASPRGTGVRQAQAETN
jgi:hypothetical protein